ncbi:hypothetical protein GOC33_31445 [Sinorhizobium meliloti]|nr:hypothetical protein [Sinorhizobium meliloti]
MPCENKSENAVRRLLGIIELDCEDATGESSVELSDRGALTPFRYCDPQFWPIPFQNVVALGATPSANKVPTPEAAGGILDAAMQLDGRAQLIIGNCGFMWASRSRLYGQTSTATLTSGLEFLDLALRMTNRPIGIITWDADPLVLLLKDHPQKDRLCLISVCDLPEWKKAANEMPAYLKPGGWTKEQMEQELSARLIEAFATGGALEEVGIMLLECTYVADFRHTIRAITPLPVIDLLHFAKMALE